MHKKTNAFWVFGILGVLGLIELPSIWILSTWVNENTNVMGGTLGVVGMTIQWILDLITPNNVAAGAARILILVLLPFPIWLGIAWYEYRKTNKHLSRSIFTSMNPLITRFLSAVMIGLVTPSLFSILYTSWYFNAPSPDESLVIPRILLVFVACVGAGILMMIERRSPQATTTAKKSIGTLRSFQWTGVALGGFLAYWNLATFNQLYGIGLAIATRLALVGASLLFGYAAARLIARRETFSGTGVFISHSALLGMIIGAMAGLFSFILYVTMTPLESLAITAGVFFSQMILSVLFGLIIGPLLGESVGLFYGRVTVPFGAQRIGGAFIGALCGVVALWVMTPSLWTQTFVPSFSVSQAVGAVIGTTIVGYFTSWIVGIAILFWQGTLSRKESRAYSLHQDRS